MIKVRGFTPVSKLSSLEKTINSRLKVVETYLIKAIKNHFKSVEAQTVKSLEERGKVAEARFKAADAHFANLEKRIAFLEFVTQPSRDRRLAQFRIRMGSKGT